MQAAVLILTTLVVSAAGQSCSSARDCPVNYYCAGGRCTMRNTNVFTYGNSGVFPISGGSTNQFLQNLLYTYAGGDALEQRLGGGSAFGLNTGTLVNTGTNYINPFTGTNTGINPFIGTGVNPFLVGKKR